LRSGPIHAKVTADSRLAYQSTTNLVGIRGSFFAFGHKKSRPPHRCERTAFRIGGPYAVGYGGFFPYSSGGAGQGGATAAGFALSQGHIRPIDLLAGRIPYAIFMSTPCENGHISPAIGDDNEHIAGCPPIGSHLWLDSTPDEIAASGTDRYWQVVMNALHEFGGYIGDHASTNLGVAPEGGLAYQAFGDTNPWISIIASDFPNEVPSGTQLQYHLRIDTGNIDLSQHLHVIAYP